MKHCTICEQRLASWLLCYGRDELCTPCYDLMMRGLSRAQLIEHRRVEHLATVCHARATQHLIVRE